MRNVFRRLGWRIKSIVTPPLMLRYEENKWKHGGRKGKKRPIVTRWKKAHSWREARDLARQGWRRQCSIGFLLNPRNLFKSVILGYPT